MEVCNCRTLMSPNLPQSLIPGTKPFLSLNYPFISGTIPGRVNLNTFFSQRVRATSSEDDKSTQFVVVRNESAEKEEESTQDFPAYHQTQAAFHFLDKLDVKLDSEDTPSMLLLGGGSLIAVWIATVVVGAIDSIPLFPKLMEVVGLAYTLWFSTRYLLFKKNREELVVKIEEIKQQVLGSSKSD